MKWTFIALLTIHGLIHLMGPVKAFGLADLPQLTLPISRVGGLAWLAAGLAMFATAAMLVVSPRQWWVAGLVAVLLSQAVIIGSWGDARFGTIANLLVLAGVIYGFASQGPWSLRAEYAREVGALLASAPASAASAPLLTEDDLAPLPQLVQRYLRLTGAVGQPRVDHFRVMLRGRIRASVDDPWMSFTAEQTNVVGEPARFFLMDARKVGLPVDVLHVYRAGQATMRVRLLSLLQIVNVAGPELDHAETVTVFNDLCVLAPAALVEPGIRWEPVDATSVRAFYTVGPNTISAVLHFNEVGELIDFESDDRLVASADFKEFAPMRWSTPVSSYRDFGTRRGMSVGEAWWHGPNGDFAYIEMEVLGVEVGGRYE